MSVQSSQNSKEEIEEEQQPPVQEETPSGRPVIPFLLSLVAFIPLAIAVGYFLSVGEINNSISEMAARNALRTPVYFFSHGGVSCPYI